MKETEFREGVRDTLPLVFGMIPFGLAYGILGKSIGLSSGETTLMSLLVFAGAAQFICLPMFVEGASLFMIGFTTLLINLRHLLMGASLAPYMSELSMPIKAVLSFGMTDETYAVTINQAQAGGYSSAYQLGSNSTCYIVWLVSTVGGVILGSRISDPLSWGLDFAMPATFLALLIPRLRDKVSLIVCLVAVAVSIGAVIFIPGKWYIIIACLAGVIAGAFMERGKQDAD
jgi:4-azaleucine resistance transporter AzlC